mmetsp:Transcript_13096/g.29789  ORF Transcript_13096/g.29789 Transcript_13096/m.29789 type:complete len:234 (+) Transcript_13096:74-775(+)
MADGTSPESQFIQVVSLSGNSATVQLDESDTLAELVTKAVAGLGVEAPDGAHLLLDGKAVSDLALLKQMGDEVQELQVVVKAPSEWFAGHKFSYSAVRGRRCGMQEDDASGSFSLHADGTFTYEWKSHSHDHEPDYSCSEDTRTTASGTWACTADTQEVVLTGTMHFVRDERFRQLITSEHGSDDEADDVHDHDGWRSRSTHTEDDAEMNVSYSRAKLSGADWKRVPLASSAV